MRSVNEQFKKLKACPFCGKKPEVVGYDVDPGNGYCILDLRCCMNFHIESSLMCFNGVNEYGRKQVITFVDKNPIDIWNNRAQKRRVKKKEEKK